MRLGDTVASVRELANGDSIAQRSQRGDRRLVDEWRLGDTVASVRELANGESIAQRSRRSQRGDRRLVDECDWVDTVASVRELANGESIAQRSQRGDRRLVDECDWGTLWLLCGNTRMGKASHGGQGGGIGDWSIGRRMRMGGHWWLPCGNWRPRQRTLNARRRNILANLYGSNRVTPSLCGFALQTGPHRKWLRRLMSR